MSKKGFIPTNLLLPLHITFTRYQPLFYLSLPNALSDFFNLFRIVFTIVSVTIVIITIVFFAMVSGVG
jgi:hypothetical protein